jgi:hypothetical protein
MRDIKNRREPREIALLLPILIKPDRLMSWLSVVVGCHMVYEAANAPLNGESAVAALLLKMAKALAGEITPVPPKERALASVVRLDK